MDYVVSRPNGVDGFKMMLLRFGHGPKLLHRLRFYLHLKSRESKNFEGVGI